MSERDLALGVMKSDSKYEGPSLVISYCKETKRLTTNRQMDAPHSIIRHIIDGRIQSNVPLRMCP